LSGSLGGVDQGLARQVLDGVRWTAMGSMASGRPLSLLVVSVVMPISPGGATNRLRKWPKPSRQALIGTAGWVRMWLGARRSETRLKRTLWVKMMGVPGRHLRPMHSRFESASVNSRRKAPGSKRGGLQGGTPQIGETQTPTSRVAPGGPR
jgi:hypothetical protein